MFRNRQDVDQTLEMFVKAEDGIMRFGGKDMRNWILIVFLSFTVTWPVLSQQEASMSAPILRSTAEEIGVTTRFTAFPSGNDYRLGVGSVGGVISDLKIELSKGDTQLSKNVETFSQGYTQSWFDVEKISVQGYHLAAGDLPASGEELILTISVPRSEAERLTKFFVILARKYNPDRWYVVEGAEIDESLF